MEINYRLNNIVEESYKFNYDFKYDFLDKDKLLFNFTHIINVDKENQQISITFNACIVYDDIKLVCQGIRGVFDVDPIESFVEISDSETLQISQPILIDTFISVLIGAVRGMLIKSLKNTPLEGVVLPLIPMDVIRKNFVKK